MSFNSQNIVYMNGPTPVAEPTAIINPKNNNMNTSGIIHINLRFQKKVKTSPAILNLLKISFNIRIFPNYISIETPPTRESFLFRYDVITNNKCIYSSINKSFNCIFGSSYYRFTSNVK